METIHTKYLGDLRTEAVHLQSGTTIVTDAPVDNHGKGEAFSPTDLLATSLGSCMLNVMGTSAKIYGFTIDGATVTTTKVMGTNPRRVAELRLEVILPHDNYTDKERRIIELAARECPVAQSLHPDVKQTISIGYRR